MTSSSTLSARRHDESTHLAKNSSAENPKAARSPVASTSRAGEQSIRKKKLVVNPVPKMARTIIMKGVTYQKNGKGDTLTVTPVNENNIEPSSSRGNKDDVITIGEDSDDEEQVVQAPKEESSDSEHSSATGKNDSFETEATEVGDSNSLEEADSASDPPNDSNVEDPSPMEVDEDEEENFNYPELKLLKYPAGQKTTLSVNDNDSFLNINFVRLFLENHTHLTFMIRLRILQSHCRVDPVKNAKRTSGENGAVHMRVGQFIKLNLCYIGQRTKIKCLVCKKTFADQWTAICHLESHVRKFICLIVFENERCSETCESSKSFVLHVLTHHHRLDLAAGFRMLAGLTKTVVKVAATQTDPDDIREKVSKKKSTNHK